MFRLHKTFPKLALLSCLSWSVNGASYGYIVNAYSNSISRYAISPESGALIKVGPDTKMPPGTVDPEDAALDNRKRFLYTANWQGNNISVFKIDYASGNLTPVSEATASGVNPWTTNLEPEDRFAYVGNTGDGTISEYIVDQASGELHPLDTLRPPYTPIAPGGIKFDPSGKYVYVLDYQGNSINRYEIDQQSGKLHPVQLREVPTGINPRVMTIISGKFAYVINQSSNNISGYTLDPESSALTPIPGQPFYNPGIQPMGAKVDPIYNRYYVVNQASATVAIYQVDSNSGKLILKMSQPLARSDTGNCTASMPRNISFDNDGHAYVNDQQGNTLNSYKIEPDTGKLICISKVTTGIGPWGSMQVVN